MFGDTDDLSGWKHGWELVVHESLPGLSFWAYKRRLRKGLYLYKNKTGMTVIKGQCKIDAHINKMLPNTETVIQWVL